MRWRNWTLRLQVHRPVIFQSSQASAFRYVTIKDHPDQRHFLNYPTLQKLGLYLIDTYKFNADAKRRSLPLVLCALNPVTETYLVVGLWNTQSKVSGTARAKKSQKRNA